MEENCDNEINRQPELDIDELDYTTAVGSRSPLPTVTQSHYYLYYLRGIPPTLTSVVISTIRPISHTIAKSWPKTTCSPL